MNMKVITKFYDADQAAVMAVQAGNDMILMPDNFEQAFEGVLEAVKDGTISESKINEAVSRILSVKSAEESFQQIRNYFVIMQENNL